MFKKEIPVASVYSSYNVSTLCGALIYLYHLLRGVAHRFYCVRLVRAGGANKNSNGALGAGGRRMSLVVSRGAL